MNDDPDGLGPPQAITRRSRRIPLIWIVPILALAIGAWLAWDAYSKRGPTITVTFDSAEGLKPGQSALRFKDLQLGTVSDITLAPDQSHVIVTIATVRQAAHLFTDQTVFWVVKPRLFAGNLSGLDTLLSGSYVGMLPSPAEGKPQFAFTGKEDPPVLDTQIPGRTILVKAERIGSISLGSPVFFRDITVGEVLGWDLGDLARDVTIRVFVRAPFDKYVDDSTKFWDASGVSLALGGGGVQLKVESVKAILLGGIAFDTALGEGHTAVVTPGRVYPLFPDRGTAEAASYTRKVAVLSYFAGSVSGLGPGSAVTLHGLTVGKVLSVKLAYDRTKDAIVAPVRYEIEPERILGVGAGPVFDSIDEAARQMLRRGLRASLQSSNLITGQQSVALRFDADAPHADLIHVGDDILLPSVESGGFDSLATSATKLMTNVNAIPFQQIGDDLHATLTSLNQITGSAQLRQALTNLYGSVASAENLLQHLDSGMGPAMKQLPQISTEMQRSLATANTLMQSIESGYGDNTKFNRDLEHLLVRIDDAVRSIQSLTDLLGRHPEALIKGRPAGGIE